MKNFGTEELIKDLKKIYPQSTVNYNKFSFNLKTDKFKACLEVAGREEVIIDVISFEVKEGFRRKGIFESFTEHLKKLSDVVVFSGVCNTKSLQAIKKFGALKTNLEDESRLYNLHDSSSLREDWEYFEVDYGNYYLKKLF